MAEGNGVDLGALVEMVKGVVVAVDRMTSLQDRMLAEQQRMAVEQQRMGAILSNVSGDLTELRKEVGLYHGSVIGHGILITELDERVTLLERERPGSGRP